MKREREALAKFRENEAKAKKDKENYRTAILQQIANEEEKKKTQLRYKREVPDIAGIFGYPSIKQPTQQQEREKIKRNYKKQKETLLEQVTLEEKNLYR